MAGVIDVDVVVNSISTDKFLDWWAYGLLNGWFPSESAESKQMTPEQSAKVMEERYRGQHNNPHARL